MANDTQTTPQDVATADMLQLVAELNKRAIGYRAEGLPFSFTADPAFVGIALMVPVARVTMPVARVTMP